MRTTKRQRREMLERPAPAPDGAKTPAGVNTVGELATAVATAETETA